MSPHRSIPPVTRPMLQFGSYLTSIGSLTYPPKALYPCAGHPEAYLFDKTGGRKLPEHALVLICAGSGTFQSSRIAQCPVKAGDAFYLPPGEWHRFRPLAATGWSEKWITFNGAMFHGLRKSAILPSGSKLLQHPEKACSLLDRLLADVRRSPKH